MTGSSPAAFDVDTLGAPAESSLRRSMLDAHPVRARNTTVIAGAGTVVVHVLLVLLAMFIGTGLAAKKTKALIVTQMFEVELPKEVTPEPEPEPEAEPEEKPEPKPFVRVPAPPKEHIAKPEAPPPAAAQAAQVLTAKENVVDFGDTFVAGKSASYAGGVTEAGGTAKQAVRDVNARAGGVLGGTGTNLTADLTRVPQLAGGAEWDCPFPIEADDAGVDHAVVTLRVEVSATGEVIRVQPTRGSGHGFGHEARRCALGKRWAPGLDRAGKPTGAVAVVNVKFDR